MKLNKKDGKEDPEIEIVEGDEAAPAAKQSNKKEPAPAKAEVEKSEPVAQASMPVRDKDSVTFVPFETMEPPPTIGTYDVARQLNITKMVKLNPYVIPRGVAMVLIDKKWGIIKN